LSELRYGGQISLGPPGTTPSGIAYDNESGEMFVTEAPAWVTVLSGSPLEVVSSIYLGANSYPSAIAYDAANDTVFVGTSPSSVVVISASSHALLAHVNVGFPAVTLAYDPATRDVYAGAGLSNLSDDNVTVINGTTYAISDILGYPQIAALNPFAIAYSPISEYLIVLGYAGASGWNGVAAFDPATGKAVWDDTGNITTMYGGLAVDPADGRLFLPNSRSVSVLNGTTGAMISQIALPAGSDGAAAYNPISTDVLVGEFGGIVQAIETSSPTLLPPVRFIGSADSIAVNASTGDAYVVDGDISSVAVLASNDSALLGISNIGGGPTAITSVGTGGTIYVTDSDNVSVINSTTHKVVDTISVGADPEGILYDPASNDVFVANSDGGTVSVISTRTNAVVANVSVDSAPWALAWDNLTNEVYVTCMNFTGSRALVDVISAGTMRVVDRISLGATVPDGIAYVPPLNEVFVDNNPLSYYPPLNLTVISATTNLVVSSFALPSASAPGQIVFDNVTQELYVAGSGYAINRNYRDDIVINPFNRSIVGTIPVGLGPFGIAVETGTTYVFTTAWESDAVSLVDGATRNISSSTQVGPTALPEGVAYDASNNEVFVADWGNDSVSYLLPPETYRVTFVESGLPSGTPWGVAVNGTVLSSTTSFANLSESNGSYSFSVSPLTGFSVNVSSGTVRVNGLPVSQSLVFRSTSPGGLLGLPSVEAYALIGGTIAVVGAVVILLAGHRRRSKAAAGAGVPPLQPNRARAPPPP
jgi:YVTN family beta-propeller protein